MGLASVLVVDQSIESKGVVTNAGFVLGLTAGRLLPDSAFGADALDGEGKKHCYLTNIGHMVRKAGQSKLKALRDELSAFSEVTVVDYTEDAAPADYAAYTQSLASRSGEDLRYRAVYFYGPEELLVPRTKNLSRLS